jgi:hypothetical protein
MNRVPSDLVLYGTTHFLGGKILQHHNAVQCWSLRFNIEWLLDLQAIVGRQLEVATSYAIAALLPASI